MVARAPRPGGRWLLLWVGLVIVLVPVVDGLRNRPTTVRLTETWPVGADYRPQLHRFDAVEPILTSDHLRQYVVRVDRAVDVDGPSGTSLVVDPRLDLLRVQVPLPSGGRLQIDDQIVAASGVLTTAVVELPGDPGLVSNGSLALMLATITTLTLAVAPRLRTRHRRGYRHLRSDDELFTTGTAL